ncbi:MAG: hypothetical protein JSC189_000188 [Candidatus Tokpelaia sp. JSC189]|nr:MAG: hypothetical protein JSC189_000188 [Candidatus Tokpelaia sp. JSC189]
MKNIIALALLFILAGCIRSNEIALAPNVIRINTQASGGLSIGKANTEMMKKAAETTINRGYTHFIISDYSYGNETIVSGVNHNTYGTINGTTFGAINNNMYMGNALGTYNSNTYSNVITMPVERSSMTIIMFKQGDKTPPNAWEAKIVLDKGGKM